MEWVVKGLAALVLGVLALLAWVLVHTLIRLTRLRLRNSTLGVLQRDAIPEPIRLTLDKSQPFLEGLGFHYRYSTASERSVEAEGDPLIYCDVYQHVEGHSHALVTPSLMPEAGTPCTIIWATLLRSGRTLGTVNCYAHNLICAPAGWDLHDDYLPDLRQAWQAHLRRLATVRESIVDDGVEFFRASRLATERLMPYCEKQGLLVHRDGYWQMRWRAALGQAVKLILGQHKVARVRARAIKDSSGSEQPAELDASLAPQRGLEADIQAFEQHLVVVRSTRGSRSKKIKVFVVTAALFLGVGSLWISWTFLPILLAVIALHEAGHFLAMKVSGYRNLSVFFVPGLGGAATGEKASASPWEKLFVYLAGPMPGIALAVGGLVGQLAGVFQPPGWFQEFLLACLAINYLNLLPITPLDGGRVVETFLFARLPLARFVFAVLGLAAFLAFGLATGDKVMLVIAVLLGLGLPHQWRLMRVDRVIVRHARETLDERGAIERVFTALQNPRFAGWPFAQRAAAATALLPELQGRRASAAEALGGMVIYLACLLGPPALAILALPPQFSAVFSALVSGFNRVPDDVDPEPPSPQVTSPPRDVYAEAANLQSLPESQRLQVLLDAADLAAVSRDEGKLQAFLKAAWDIAGTRPVQDYERARTLMAMAGETEQAQQRQQWLKQVVAGLDGLHDKPSLLLLAEAHERLAWETDSSGPQRIALLRRAVALRTEALPEGGRALNATRLALAQALDAQGAPQEAEVLLRENIQGIAMPAPHERSREALYRRTQRVGEQVQLAWFLIDQGRQKEASAVLELAASAVPGKISVSWEFPNRQVREAQLWAKLQDADAHAIKESWQRYETSRDNLPHGKTPNLLHEMDRFIVAQATGDGTLGERARASIAQSPADSGSRHSRARLCGEPAQLQWKSKQRQARIQAANALGVCGKA